jgi:hypothetical protein
VKGTKVRGKRAAPHEVDVVLEDQRGLSQLESDVPDAQLLSGSSAHLLLVSLCIFQVAGRLFNWEVGSVSRMSKVGAVWTRFPTCQ